MKFNLLAMASSYVNNQLPKDSTIIHTEDEKYYTAYHRVSEPFEVEVPMLETKERIAYQVKSIDEQIKKVEGEAYAKVSGYKKLKAELLCIEYTGTENEK
jgi:hypothetical protein